MPAPLFDNRYFNDPITSIKDVIDYAERYPHDDIRPYILSRLESLSEKIKKSPLDGYNDNPSNLIDNAKSLFSKSSADDVRKSILSIKDDVNTLNYGVGDRMRWCTKDEEFINAKDETTRLRNIHSYVRHGSDAEEIKRNNALSTKVFKTPGQPYSWLAELSYHEASVGILREQQQLAQAAAVSHAPTLQGNNVVALETNSSTGTALAGTASKQPDTSKVAARK